MNDADFGEFIKTVDDDMSGQIVYTEVCARVCVCVCVCHLRRHTSPPTHSHGVCALAPRPPSPAARPRSKPHRARQFLEEYGKDIAGEGYEGMLVGGRDGNAFVDKRPLPHWDLAAVALALDAKLATKGGKASAIFRHYDEDKSGALSRAEFRKAIESLNIQARAPRREPLALPPGMTLSSSPNRSRASPTPASSPTPDERRGLRRAHARDRPER